MRRVRAVWLVALMMTMILSLSACGSGSQPQEQGSATPSSAPSASPAKAPVKDSIKIALSAGVDRLDPALSANGTDMLVMAQVFETLLSLNPDNGQLVPRLATSWTAVNPTTWQFKLRANVKFHNGEPFDAQAVKFSIERNLDPETKSPHRSQIALIERVDIVDPLTVNIVTKAPMPVLPYRMQPFGGSGRIFIMPPKYFAEKSAAGFNENPVGTGPYKLTNWDKGKSMTFVRNDEYWGEKPELRQVDLHFITENSTRVGALLSGEMDLIQRLPPDDIKRVQSNKNVRVIEDPNGMVHVFFVDPSQPPLGDPRVRLAMSLAINMEEIVDSILLGKGRVLPVPVAPTVYQYNSALKPPSHDLQRAKELMKEAGQEKGFTLKTYMSDGRYIGDKAIYEAVNAQLKQIGITIEPQVMEWARLIRMIQEKKAGPFYMVGWDFGEGDASKLDSLFHSGSSVSLWQLPRYDELSKQANSEMDPEKRKTVWMEAQKVVANERAFLAAWQTPVLYGMSASLDWVSKFGENLEFKDIRPAVK